MDVHNVAYKTNTVITFQWLKYGLHTLFIGYNDISGVARGTPEHAFSAIAMFKRRGGAASLSMEEGVRILTKELNFLTCHFLNMGFYKGDLNHFKNRPVQFSRVENNFAPQNSKSLSRHRSRS